MLFRQLRKLGFGSDSGSQVRPNKASPRRRTSLHLEPLEDRTMPAPFNFPASGVSPVISTANSAKVTTHAQPQASILTWTGGGGDDKNWSNPKNWQGNTIPTTNDMLIFPATLSGQSNDDIPGLELRRIALNGTNYNLTASSGVKLTLNDSITQTLHSTTIYNIPTALNGHVTFALDGLLTVRVSLTDGSGPGQLTVTNYSAGLQGSRLVLEAKSSYSGGTVVQRTEVDCRVANALGTGGLALKDGSELKNNSLKNEMLTFSNAVTLEGHVVIAANYGLDFSGAVTVSAAGCELSYSGNPLLYSHTSGTNGKGYLLFDKAGSLSGPGTLSVVQIPNSLGAVPLELAGAVQATVVANITAQLFLDGTTQGTGAITVQGGSLSVMAASATYTGSITLISGTIKMPLALALTGQVKNGSTTVELSASLVHKGNQFFIVETAK